MSNALKLFAFSLIATYAWAFTASIPYIESQYTPNQQRLISEMKKSMEHKISSKAYGDRFVELLNENTEDCGVYGRFSVHFEPTSSSIMIKSDIVMINPKFDYPNRNDNIKANLRYITDVIRRNTPNAPINPFDFFTSLVDHFSLSEAALDYAKKHIIFLTAEKFEDQQEFQTLIPDLWVSDSTFKSFLPTFKKASEINFYARRPVAKFIGALSGVKTPSMRPDNTTNSRLLGFSISQKEQSLIDIKLTDYWPECPEFNEYMVTNFPPPPLWEPEEELPNNRYLVSFDGYISSWKRPELIMHSGSVALLQSRYQKFWTSLLVNGVNYIKIKDDVSSLLDTVRFLNESQGKGQQIAQAAQTLANDVLIPEFFDQFFAELFQEVGRLQNIP